MQDQSDEGADLLTRADAGDKQAQNAFVTIALQHPGTEPLAVAYLSERWKREALARTNGDDDMLGLAGALMFKAQVIADLGEDHPLTHDCTAIMAEAITLLDLLADRGDERAAEALVVFAEHLPSDAFDLARLIERAAR